MTIVSRTEHNVEFAQGKTITSIVEIGFVKNVANARISQAWDVQEISVAPGRRRDDHHEPCEYLYNSAIRQSASHAWQVMQRRLTGYIAFGATSRVRSILQLSAPGSKTTGGAHRLQEEDLNLHHGIPSKVVLFKFHRTFLWSEHWVAHRSRPEGLCQAPGALQSH